VNLGPALLFIGRFMQASTRRHPDYIAAAPVAIAIEEQSNPRWVLSLIVGSTATWVTIFGAAKLLMALI
jgi:hypothetical protein